MTTQWSSFPHAFSPETGERPSIESGNPEIAAVRGQPIKSVGQTKVVLRKAAPEESLSDPQHAEQRSVQPF